MGVVATIGALVAGCGGGSNTAGPGAPGSVTTAPAASTTAVATQVGRAYPPGRNVVTFDVNGVRRTAVVVVPTKLSHPAPLVFVFHGHGGSGARIERKFDIEGLWRDAIVVYPDGLVGHQGRTDPKGVKPGWQTRLGERGDRDLAFYDTMHSALTSRLPVDRNRVYLMGHSNGSAFVSLLFNQRGSGIAATANLSGQPSGTLAGRRPGALDVHGDGQTRPDRAVCRPGQEHPDCRAQARSGSEAPRRSTDTSAPSAVRGTWSSRPTSIPADTMPPPEVPGLVVAFFQRHTRSTG